MVFDVPKISSEEQRLRALAEYRILGTQPEQCYDDITRIASLTCGTPISLMRLVDADKKLQGMSLSVLMQLLVLNL